MNDLMIHAKEKDGTKRARIVTRDELVGLVTPPPQGPRHKPVPHTDLVDGLLNSLDRSGFDVTREQYAVGMRRKGPDGEVYPDTTIFGALNVRARGGNGRNPDTEDYTRAIGFRSNNVQALAIKLVAGANVFVCDNLCLSGEQALCNKQHTTGLNLPVELDRAVNGLVGQGQRFDELVEAMQDCNLPARQAQALLFSMFAKKVLPLRLLPEVNGNYFSPKEEWEDCKPRTVWGVHNAVTRALNDLPLNRRLDSTADTTRFLAGAFNLN